MNKYDILYENYVITNFNYYDGHILNIEPNYKNEKHFPYFDYTKVTEDSKWRTWIRSRMIPSSRTGVGMLAFSNSEISPMSLMLSNYGLSLKDHYWIRPHNSDLYWDCVNPWKNKFYCENISSVDTSSKDRFNPSYTLNGDLKKKWIIDNFGNRKFIKSNMDQFSCIQSVAEVLASMIYERQNTVEFVKYDFYDVLDDGVKVTGVICDNFLEPDEEFIPAWDLCTTRKKSNNESWYDLFVNRCIESGLDKEQVLNYLDTQILVDYLIINVDRHFNNFGVVAESGTHRIKKVAPIFDGGNALYYNGYAYDNPDDMHTSSFRTREKGLVALVNNYKAIDLDKLPSPTEVYDFINKYRTAADAETGFITRQYRKRINYIKSKQTR